MNLRDKRYPAYNDTDIIPFGQYGPKSARPKLLQDVPARYLAYLYYEFLKDGVSKLDEKTAMNTNSLEKLKLFNYIWNSQSAIADELKENFP